ncbi:hypothetical protein PR202_gb02782 [Eleusine coracana subsp. coracana]|uniref:Caffeoyl-CoA O-methyltransferase n=1 Tax=Eleusine coracana subsp. coracana TaxID=191504 RepID=A0AAV5DXN3_ELECO|nr:hypothetical protein PR202_gb02782 [Eleusine coracana subsp. coracana]
MADGGGELKNIHGEDSTKTLLKNEALYEVHSQFLLLLFAMWFDLGSLTHARLTTRRSVSYLVLFWFQYMLNTMVYPREHECLRKLRLITKKHAYGHMSSPPDEALLLSMLLKLTGARNTIEVGVFTGCSVLATALAIPDDGKVVAIDVSREYFDIGLPLIEKAGVAHKVDFREGPAQPILDEMLADEGNEGKFDFAFVDADKGNYGGYHEQLLRLVRVGGVLAYDNTLWGGTVGMPDDTPLTEHDREIRDVMRAFNAKIAADQRVEVVQLPIADGITLCRRVV